MNTLALTESKNIKVYGTLINHTQNSSDTMRDNQHNDFIAVAYQLYDERFSPKRGSGDNGTVTAIDRYQDIINKRLTAIYYDERGDGKTIIDGDVDITGNLTAENVSFNNDVTFNDETTFNENVTFNDETTFNENVNFNDDINIDGDVYITDNHDLNTYNLTVRHHADILDLTIDTNTPGHIHGVYLNDLEDVNISNLQDGQVLTYDSSLRKWVAKDVESGGGSGGGISYKVVKRTGEWISITSSGGQQWFLPYYSMSISDAEHVASAFCDSYTNGVSGILRTILACDYISEAYPGRPAIGWFGDLQVSENYSQPANPIFTFIMSNAVVDGNTTTEGDLIVNGDLTVTGDTTLNNLTVSGDISGISLNDLDDVNAPSPQSGQVLKWNGSKWAPAADNQGGGSGGGVDLSSATGSLPLDKLDTTGATTGDIIKFDGTKWAIGTDDTGSGSSAVTDPDSYEDPESNIHEWSSVEISSNGFYGVWRPIRALKSFDNWREDVIARGGSFFVSSMYGFLCIPMTEHQYDKIATISITRVYYTHSGGEYTMHSATNTHNIDLYSIYGTTEPSSIISSATSDNDVVNHANVTFAKMKPAANSESMYIGYGSVAVDGSLNTQYMPVPTQYQVSDGIADNTKGLIIPIEVGSGMTNDITINEYIPFFVVRVSFV